MILALLLGLAASQCVEYQKNYPSYYCDDFLDWEVSSAVYEERWQRNKEAYERYFDLKTRYLNKGDEDHPKLECLAIARKFYCAYSFPYCTHDEPQRGICEFLCELWKDRCPEEDYEAFCASKESEKCSFSNALGILALLILIFL